MEEDKDLIKGLIEGKKSAFDTFIDKYSRDVLKTISYVLNSPHEKEYIDECFDDVVVKVFDVCSTFKFECSFRIWIIKISKNKALDYKRKLKKMNVETNINDTLRSEFNIEEKYLKTELKKEINNTINELKNTDRKLFIDRYVLEYSTEYLCKNYFVSENVLYKRLSRLREKFRRIWTNLHDGEEDF